MSNPLPPKTSMYWNDHPYTYEEAVAVFEKDGSLFSLTEAPVTPSNDIEGSPPENSMFWEGGTEKIDPPTIPEPRTIDMTQRNEPKEVGAAHFIPVRYAIDQTDSEETSPFGFPKDWKGKVPTKLDTIGYTLRQLRDGWLYVYDSDREVLDEYEVKGTQFTLHKLGETENPESDTRGTPESPTTFLSYRDSSLLSLCFSEHRWTWKMFLTVAENPSSHIDRMQTVVLTASTRQRHIAPIDQLSEVADIEASAIDDGRFADSWTKTKADEEGALFKPVACESDLTAALPEKEDAYFVAINDYAADIQDMAIQFVGAASPYRLFVDQFSNQWQLMQTAMQLCMFGASDEIDMPFTVTRNQQELAFYSDMAEYYDASSNLDKAVKNKAAAQSGYPAQYASGAIESNQQTQSTIAQAIQDKYCISESKFGYYEQWIAKERWRKQLNWKQMLSDMQALSEQKNTMLAQVTSVKRDFISVLESLTPHHLERVFDLYSEETQLNLYQLNLVVSEAFSIVVEEEDRQWAEDQWENPTSLLPLYTSGFSRTLYSELTSVIPGQAATSNDEDEWLDHVSSASSKVGMYAKIMDFVSNPNTAETEILRDVAKGFKELDVIFKATISAALKGVGGNGVSIAAQSSILMMQLFSKPLTKSCFVFRAIIAERMAQTVPVQINDNYAQEFKKWKGRIESNLEQLEKTKRIIAEVNQNQRKATAKYKKALEDQSRLKRTLAVTTQEYPHRIVLPDDILQATQALWNKQINQVATDAHKLFENAGGLGFLALLFNCIALGDAMSRLAGAGLVSSDEALEIQQKLLYTANAWTGIRTGKLWGKVKGEPELRAHSYKMLKKLVSNNGKRFSNLKLDDLRVFNKWLAITGALGALASGIEAYRSWQRHDEVHGRELMLQGINTFTLGFGSAIGVFQLIGSASGILSANLLYGAPVMAALVIVTAINLINNFVLSKVKQDDYQKWLDKLPWGYHPERAHWSQSSSLIEREQQNSALVQQAMFELQSIIQQPVVFHQPLEEIKAFPRYTYHQLIGLEVHIQLPYSVAVNGFTVRTNTGATEEILTSGTWHKNTDLVTLQSQSAATPESMVYKVVVPLEEGDKYFAMHITYDVEEGAPAKREYWFQNSVKQSASYSVITDTKKQDTINRSLTPIIGILGFQE